MGRFMEQSYRMGGGGTYMSHLALQIPPSHTRALQLVSVSWPWLLLDGICHLEGAVLPINTIQPLYVPQYGHPGDRLDDFAAPH